MARRPHHLTRFSVRLFVLPAPSLVRRAATTATTTTAAAHGWPPLSPQPATIAHRAMTSPSPSAARTVASRRRTRSAAAAAAEEAAAEAFADAAVPSAPKKPRKARAAPRKQPAPAREPLPLPEPVSARKPAAKPDDDGACNFFLVKSEPESRVQNGQEMKFSIDDLADEPNATACWDGVRNFEARNVMQSMRLGDRAFFYHSNSRKVRPAVVGEVEIVKESYPDHTAFDRKDAHYDAKSDPAKPRWFMVDVKLLRKFDTPVTLDEIKKTPELANMQLVKRGRISVQRVMQREWQLIVAMAERRAAPLEDATHNSGGGDGGGGDEDKGGDVK